MSFNSEGYMTRGYQSEIPDVVKLILAKLIDVIASKDSSEIDYLQVFDLKKEYIGDTLFQRIEHSQEIPPFKQVFCFPLDEAVEQKVFCIDSEEYYIYMLAEEY